MIGLRQLTKIATDLHMPSAAEYNSSLSLLESKFPDSAQIKHQPEQDKVFQSKLKLV
jgi:hypothetical protein